MSGNSTKRDANFRTVYSAEGDDSLTHAWSIDSVTGRVLMEIHLTNDTSYSAPKNRALKDANYRNTLTGLTDDGSNHPLSVAIDHTDGFMGVDLLIE